MKTEDYTLFPIPTKLLDPGQQHLLFHKNMV